MKRNPNKEKTDLTILMPCLNEEENIGYCIAQAQKYLSACAQKAGTGRSFTGEVLIVDNGSTDRSVGIAKAHGARVVREPRRGYGRALRTGLKRARGDVIIFGDCDSTYDFLHLDPLYRPLAEGRADFMTGNRFGKRGGKPVMEEGAMSLSHRIGVPFLSICGRIRYRVGITDFHCGLRGIRRDALERCAFHTDGMEFATEMIAEAARRGLRIGQVSVPLRKSRKERTEKLRTVRDGLRHLWYIVKS